jgi:SAM-dependent methyltransferase
MEEIAYNGVGYTQGWDVNSPTQCRFYHSLDLPGGETQVGDWDLRGRFAEYIGGVDLKGKRVLDVGTASGFLAFEAEKVGAREVVAFDAAKRSAGDLIPTNYNRTNAEQVEKTLEQQFRKIKNSFWYSHRRLNSKVKAYYNDVCSDWSEIGPFDVAIVAQILVHLRHPLDALQNVARVADTIVITEGLVDSAQAVLRFIWTPQNDSPVAWWHASAGFYKAFMAALEFECVSVSVGSFLCNVPGRKGDRKLQTLVFCRKGLVHS